MFLLQSEDKIHTSYVSVGNKAKASGLISALVLQYNTVFYQTEVDEIVAKG